MKNKMRHGWHGFTLIIMVMALAVPVALHAENTARENDWIPIDQPLTHYHLVPLDQPLLANPGGDAPAAAASIPGLPQLGGTVGVVGDYLAANTNALAATNWTIAPYGSYAPTLKSKYGGGLAAVYYLTPYVGTQIRAQ